MKLLYAPTSPFVRKVRAAAIELGLDGQIELELVQVAPCKPNRDYAKAHNPLRKIPALVTAEGMTIFDSTVICEYLDAMAGGGRLVPREGEARWRVLTGHTVAQGICEAAVMVRYETWLRPEALRWQDFAGDQWDRIDAGHRVVRAARGRAGRPREPRRIWRLAVRLATSISARRSTIGGRPTRPSPRGSPRSRNGPRSRSRSPRTRPHRSAAHHRNRPKPLPSRRQFARPLLTRLGLW